MINMLETILLIVSILIIAVVLLQGNKASDGISKYERKRI